jgi:putative sigma-54 modulation protein
METSDAVRSYAEEKLQRVKKYLPDPINVHVILSVEKIRHTAEISIVTNGLTIYAEDETLDMYSAIDAVLDKIERQVRKYKDKIQRKKAHHSSQHPGIKMQVLSSESFEPEHEPMIVKNKNFFAKPMSIDEAAMQMDLMHNDFLVFTNANSDNINVIYRRKDGNYGLIEPHNA